MAGVVDRDVANMRGKEALPRKNGELVFEAPWQARAFGIAIALAQQGRYPWDDFRRQLIASIAEAEHAALAVDESAATRYYEQWLASLERVLQDRGLCSPDELERRTAEFASGARDEVY
jgi:nitrile hydratase accessory protein